MTSSAERKSLTLRLVTSVVGIVSAAPVFAMPTYSPIIIENPIPQAQASFGRSAKGIEDVDADGVRDILIGARYQDVNGNVDQGRGFLFSGATLQLRRVIDSPVPGPGASFARDFDSVGDVDGDGISDLLIGAPFHTVGDVFQQGRAYLFSARTGELLHSFDNHEGHPKSHFGLTVSGLGDVDHDDVPDFVIGNHFQTVDGRYWQGRVFVFSGATGNRIHQIEHPQPQENAIFGDEVAGIGDVDGDGIPDVLTGALAQRVAVPQEQSQGQAYVFSGATGRIIRLIAHPFPQARAFFGDAVATLGDVNGDGVGDFIVGARFQDAGVRGGQPIVPEAAVVSERAMVAEPEALPFMPMDADGHCVADITAGSRTVIDGLAPDQGAVYVFSGANGELLHAIDDPTTQAGAVFGTVVDSAEDIDGDGVREVLVGAPAQTVGSGVRQGQAFVFSGATGALLVTLDNPTPQQSSAFGFPIASAGDLNDDGIPELLVGASQQQVGPNPQQGRAFLFVSNASD